MAKFAPDRPLPRARPLARSLFYLALATLPLELPITQVAHALFANLVGPAYVLFHPFTLLVFAFSMTVVPNFRLSRAEVVRVALLGVCGAGIAISSYFSASDFSLTIKYIYFGIGSATISTLIFGRCRVDQHMAKFFCFGILIWATVLSLAWIYYFLTTTTYSSRLPEKILSLRAPGESIAGQSIFFYLAGNVNKVANYTLLYMLLLGLARWKGLLGAGTYWLAQLLMMTLLVVTFSRGAFVTLAILGAGFAATAALRWRADISQSRRYLVLTSVLLLPVAVSISDGFFWDYWRNLDTVSARIHQATEVGMSVDNLLLGEKAGIAGHQLALLGYGVGNYGLVFFGDPARGTHNLFLDIWTNGGILAALGFLGFLAVSLWGGLRGLVEGWNDDLLIGVAGIVAIVILAFREYDLAYLYATSIGGLLVGGFSGLASADSPSASS